MKLFLWLIKHRITKRVGCKGTVPRIPILDIKFDLLIYRFSILTHCILLTFAVSAPTCFGLNSDHPQGAICVFDIYSI